jgi:hypothetical protein
MPSTSHLVTATKSDADALSSYDRCRDNRRGRGKRRWSGTPTRRRVIEGAGAEVRKKREVLVVDDAHDLEVIARLTRRVAAVAGGIDLIYLATDERLVLGVDDLEAARSALLRVGD